MTNLLEIFSSSNIASITLISTIVACIVGAIYTAITFSILKQNSKANALSAYLALKKDLTSDIFLLVSEHAFKNTLEISDFVTSPLGYEINAEVLKIERRKLIRDVLNNIEDLALFHEKEILEIDIIDSGYGYDILFIGNNFAIKSLLNGYNTINVYRGFDKIYTKIYNRLSKEEKNSYSPYLFEPKKNKMDKELT
jgi:hypothetical protein